MIHQLKCLCSCVLVFLTFAVNAQMATQEINLATNLPKLAPVSPDAASLGKFGQVPVSYYTGVPNISVPLYAIKTGDIEIPISINYHSGGIKVEEMPSSIGLGWALNAGGVITRSLRGLDDEGGYMFQGADARKLYNNSMTAAERDSFLLAVYHKHLDSEADIFYFNFGGISGKFFYTDNGEIVTSPRSDMKVTFASNTWYITMGNGVRYTFAATEQTESEPYCWTNLSGASNNNAAYTSVSAWKLTEVRDKNDNVVSFVYDSEALYYKTKATSTRNLLLTGAQVLPDFSYCNNVVNVNGKRLTEIHFASGKIVFAKAGGTPPDGIYPVTSITVSNSQDVQIKKYQFYNSYFGTSGVGGCEDAVTSRLRLDSVREVSASSEVIPAYKFTYDPTTIPCRLSNAQDYMGFYNGKNNTTFVLYKNSITGPLLGADKSVDFTYAKAGTLTRVDYPTGGSSNFTYEPNSYSRYSPAGFDSTNRISLVNLNGSNDGAGDYYVDFSTGFTIQSSDLDPSGNASVYSAFSYAVSNNFYYNYIQVTISGPGGYSHVVNTGYFNNTETLLLPGAGNYTIAVHVETEYAGIPSVSFNWDISKNHYTSAHYTNFSYAGLRIRSIINKMPSLPDDELYFSYNYHNGSLPDTLSSGEFGLTPEYNYELGHYTSTSEYSNYMLYNSSSNYPLQQTSGSPIGYRNITVFYGNTGSNGKKEMTFTSHSDYADSLNLGFPFPSANEYDWKRGLLTKEVIYKNLSGVFTPVQKKEIDYLFNTTDTTRKYVRSIKIGKSITNEINAPWWNLLGLQYAGYLTVAEAYNVRREKVFEYDQLGSLTNITQTEFDYNNKNFKEKRSAINTSKGDSLITTISYPVDYSASSASGTARFLNDLVEKNIISVPVEKIISRKSTSNENIVSAQLTNYQSTFLSPDKVFGLKTLSPIEQSTFVRSSVDGSNNFIFNNLYEERLRFDQYHMNGKIIQMHKTGDQPVSFILDYTNEQIVAQCVNAPYVSVSYTSFESDGLGNWDYASGGISSDATAVTGGKVYNLSVSNIQRTGLNSGMGYVLTYWLKDGSGSVSAGGTALMSKNGWTLYRQEITGVTSLTLSGSGTIDELRLYPKEAQMTSYTYKPLVGMTSQCDVNNRISYYEYDGFGRLQRIKDQDGNILKTFDYKYQQ